MPLPQPSWGSIFSFAIAPLLLLSFVIALFWHTTSFAALNWDDQLHLLNNPFIQPDSPDRFARFWRASYGQLYIPIAYNAWAIVYASCFDEAGSFLPVNLHRLNVVTHALNALLVYVFAWQLLVRSAATSNHRQWLRASAAALVGAVLFAVHPLQAESIAWISEFRGLLATFLCLATLNLHAFARDRQKLFAIALELAGATCFAAALLSKPSAAALPLMMVVIDYLLLRQPIRRIAVRLAGYFVLAIACWLATRGFQQNASAAAGPLLYRPLVATDAITFYLGKLVWPFALATDYSRTPAVARITTIFYFAWLVPAAIAVLLAYRPNRTAIACCVLFLIAIAPVLGIVPFAFQRLSTVADRYVYLAMLAPALGIGFVLASRPCWSVIAMPILALLAWRCVDQTKSWRNDEALWAHAARVNPRAAGAFANLADAAARRGDKALAKQLFDRVLEIDPHKTNGYVGNGRLRDEAGDAADALEWYLRGVDADPTDPEPHLQAGAALLALGRRDEAETHFLRAIELDPESTDALNNLGSIRMGADRLDEAMRLFDRAIAIDPRHTYAWMNRGAILLKRGDLPGYLAAMNTAIRYAGDDPTPLRKLGKTGLARKEWAAARDCFERILKIAPTDVDALNDLGQALARLGEIDLASATFEKAQALAPDSAIVARNLAAARRLKQRNSTPPAHQQ